ncbi:hypothetical protein DO64_5502 [Burkholderia pseudomallei]|nr:hypothetical protein DO64_5502 [Burkholderia pseudomallei]
MCLLVYPICIVTPLTRRHVFAVKPLPLVTSRNARSPQRRQLSTRPFEFLASPRQFFSRAMPLAGLDSRSVLPLYILLIARYSR